MASAYQVLTFDLAVPRDREEIRITRNNPVATVSVIELPAGASVSIHFGQGGAPWPLLNQGATFEPCPAEREGVFLSNPVGGGNLVLGITFEGGRVGMAV